MLLPLHLLPTHFILLMYIYFKLKFFIKTLKLLIKFKQSKLKQKLKPTNLVTTLMFNNKASSINILYFIEFFKRKLFFF